MRHSSWDWRSDWLGSSKREVGGLVVRREREEITSSIGMVLLHEVVEDLCERDKRR